MEIFIDRRYLSTTDIDDDWASYEFENMLWIAKLLVLWLEKPSEPALNHNLGEYSYCNSVNDRESREVHNLLCRLSVLTPVRGRIIIVRMMLNSVTKWDVARCFPLK